MANASSFDHNVFIAGSSFHVDLAALDARHPVHYSRRLLLFRCTSVAQRDAQLAAFKSGLQGLVSQCPVLGGSIMPLAPDEARNGKEDWRTIVPSKGLELVVRDLSSAMLSFEELEAAEFPIERLPYDLLVPVPEDLGNDRPFAACKVQFSAIHGGTILTFAMSHSVADGSATNELMRILAEETRMVQQHPSLEARKTTALTQLGLDRETLRNLTSSIPFDISDHPGYLSSLPPSLDERPPHPFSPTSWEMPVLMHVSAARLAQLKADSTPPAGPQISTHDALCALIWRSSLVVRSRRTRSKPASITSRIFMPSDARRHLNLPMSYIGNAVYQLTAVLELDRLLSSSGLQYAAGVIRTAIMAVEPEVVASYMAELKERWVDWGFMVGTSAVAVAMGTDWTSGVLYGHDWGEVFGPLVRYRYPCEGGAGACILPKLPDGSAEVMLGVMQNEVELLKGDECFGNYLGVA